MAYVEERLRIDNEYFERVCPNSKLVEYITPGIMPEKKGGGMDISNLEGLQDTGMSPTVSGTGAIRFITSVEDRNDVFNDVHNLIAKFRRVNESPNLNFSTTFTRIYSEKYGNFFRYGKIGKTNDYWVKYDRVNNMYIGYFDIEIIFKDGFKYGASSIQHKTSVSLYTVSTIVQAEMPLPRDFFKGHPTRKFKFSVIFINMPSGVTLGGGKDRGFAIGGSGGYNNQQEGKFFKLYKPDGWKIYGMNPVISYGTSGSLITEDTIAVDGNSRLGRNQPLSYFSEGHLFKLHDGVNNSKITAWMTMDTDENARKVANSATAVCLLEYLPTHLI